MYQLGFSCILCDEMGLGKTIQAIALMSFLKDQKGIKGPHLVVCPNSVVGNWQKELKKWLPGLRSEALIARKEQREKIIQEIVKDQNFDVLITSYEGVNICLKEL